MIQYVKASNPQSADVEELISKIDFYTMYPALNRNASNPEGNIIDRYLQMIDVERFAANASFDLRLPIITKEMGNKGKFKYFLKRVIGKSINWYMKDMILQQVGFNANIVRYVNAVDSAFRLYVQQNESSKEDIINLLYKKDQIL